MLGGAKKGGKVPAGEAVDRIAVIRDHQTEKSRSAAKIVLDHDGTGLFD